MGEDDIEIHVKRINIMRIQKNKLHSAYEISKMLEETRERMCGSNY